MTDGHPFCVVGGGEGQLVREGRRPVAYLAEPNFPPTDALNEPIKIILNILPSLITWNGMVLFSAGRWANSTLTRRCIARKERENVCVDNVDRSQHIRRTIMYLKPVRHFADRHRDLQTRQRSFGSNDLFRQLCGVQGPIVQRF